MKLFQFDDGNVHETAFAEDVADLHRLLAQENWEGGDLAAWQEMSPDASLTVRDDETGSEKVTRTVAEWIATAGSHRGYFTSSEA